MEILENYDLTNYSTFKIKARARYFAEFQTQHQLISLINFAKEKKIKVLCIGDGSNLIWGKELIDKLVIKNNILDFKIVKEDDRTATIKIGAGENWDSIVERSVQVGLQGIEGMSYIPGSSGGTPVQNVGAYGQEIKDTLIKVQVYDVEESKLVFIHNRDCKFTYRSSIFKTTKRDKYIITNIYLQLNKNSKPQVNYKALEEFLAEKKISSPTLQQIRNAVIEIRQSKLPDPQIIPNVGSFYGNTFVDQKTLIKLLKKHPNMPHFIEPVKQLTYKIPTAWLIDQAGLKGYRQNNLQVYEKHALIIVNHGVNTTPQELINFSNYITNKVEEKFGTHLNIEPSIIV